MRYFFIALALLGTIFAQTDWSHSSLAFFRVSLIPVQGFFLVLVLAQIYAQAQSLGRPGRELHLSFLDVVVGASFATLVSSVMGGWVTHLLHFGAGWNLSLVLHWMLFVLAPMLYVVNGRDPRAYLIYAMPLVFEWIKILTAAPLQNILWGPKQPVVVLSLIWVLCAAGAALWVWNRNQTKEGRQQLRRNEVRLREEAPVKSTVKLAEAPVESKLNNDLVQQYQASKISNFVKLSTVDPSLAEYQEVFEKVCALMVRVLKHGSQHAFYTVDQGRTYQLMAWADKNSYHKTLDQAQIVMGDGPIGSFVEAGEMITHGDEMRFPGRDHRLEYYMDQSPVGSIILKVIKDPLTHVPMGLLVLDRTPQEGLFDDDHMKLLREVTEIAAQMLLSLNRAKKLQEEEKQAKALYDCSKLMLKKIKIADILEDLYAQMDQALAPERMLLIRPDRPSRKGRVQRVYGLPITGIPLKSNGLSYAQAEDEAKFAQSLFSLSGNDLGYYAQSLVQANSFIFQTGRKGRRFHEGIVDDLEYGMVGYLKIEKSLFATVGIERSKPFSMQDLVNFRNFLMLATSALEKANTFAEREKQATVDVLTGIANHRYFQEQMDQNLVKAQSTKGNVTLLLMDIDFFKKFNDTYGHQIGDQVLKSVATALSGSIRKGVDFVARYGGEEFVVILPGLDAAQSLKSAERIRSAVESMVVDTVKGPLRVTISIGAASYPADAQAKTDLIERSDEALYHCKGRGRNCITIHRLKEESWRGAIRATNESPLEMAPAASGGIPH